MANFQDLINSGQTVLVDFSAEWCQPCKMLTPILKEVKDSVGSKVNIFKIDVDKNPQLATNYKVQSVPTLMIFKGGELKWRESGVRPAQELINLIQDLS